MIALAGAARPVTETGVLELEEAPLPSWPELPRPQHFTEPSEISAQACSPSLPSAIAVALLIPVTVTGIFESVVVPLPNSPTSLCPAHFTVPLESSAQLK